MKSILTFRPVIVVWSLLLKILELYRDMMKELNNLTHLLYQNVLDGDWSAFTLELLKTTNSNNAWMALIDNESGAPFFLNFESIVEGINKERFFQEYLPFMNDDPFRIHTLSKNELECFRSSDFITFDELTTYPIYSLFEKAQCAYVTGGVPLRDSLSFSYIVVNRGIQQGDYPIETLHLMQELVPHVNRAFTLYQKLLLQNKRLSLYESILEHNPNPLIVVSPNYDIKITNNAAEKTLSSQSLLINQQGKLRCKNMLQDSVMQTFIKSVFEWIQAKKPEPKSITVKDGNESLLLRAYPIHPETNFNNFADLCCVIEIISPKSPSWNIFQQKYNLTQKELRVVTSLYQGLDLHQMAQQFNVSLNTVKSQLMSVYSKTGFHSQRELITSLQQYILLS